MYCYRCGFEIEKDDSTEQMVMADGNQGRSHNLAKCFDLVSQDRVLWRQNKSDEEKTAFYELHHDGANPREEAKPVEEVKPDDAMPADFMPDWQEPKTAAEKKAEAKAERDRA